MNTKEAGVALCQGKRILPMVWENGKVIEWEVFSAENLKKSNEARAKELEKTRPIEWINKPSERKRRRS